MSLTTPQKEKLRADGHRSKFYLSICHPEVLLTATINNGSIARGATVIAFDGGTSADASRIREGQTLRVITSTGTYRVRIRTFSSSGSSPTLTGTIGVDNNSIPFTDNLTIAVDEFWQPTVIPPTFDPNTGISTKRNLTFLSTYTTRPGPVAKPGVHRTGFVDGSLVFTLNGVGEAMTPGATITAYAWSSTIGTIAAPGSQNTTLTLAAPGEGWLFLTVTDSNGKTHTGVRHVWGHDPDPESADYPYTDFEVSPPTLSFDGGLRTTFKISGVADFTEFVDGALVLLWREAWFGSEAGAISEITNGAGQMFLGYIVKDTIVINAEHGTVTFEAEAMPNVMKAMSMQPLSIHAESTVQYWFQMPTWMSLRHMLHWLLYWHSNVLELTDWFWPSSTIRKKLFTFNDGTLFSQAQDIASKLMAQVGCDWAGRMFVEQNIQLLPTDAARAAVEVTSDIVSSDWREEFQFIRRERDSAALTEVKGFYFDGTNVIPYCAASPGKVRGSFGGKQSADGLMLTGQTHARQLAGQLHAAANNEYEEVRGRFSGDYSVCCPFPQRWWTMDVASGDTPRGISESDMRMVPRSVTLQLDPPNGVLLAEAVFEPEAFGPVGIGVSCPNAGQAPVVVEPDWTSQPGSSGSGDSGLLSVSSVYFLSSLNATAWQVYDDNFVAYDADLDPFWKIKQASSNPTRAILWLAGAQGAVRRVVSATDKIDRFLATDPSNDWGDDPAPTVDDLTPARIVCSRFVQNRHYLAENFHNGSLWRAWIVRTENDFNAATYYTLFDSDTQTKILGMAEDGEDGSILWVTCWRDDVLYLEKYDTSDMSRSDQISLGAATLAEVNANTYTARVAAVPGDKDSVFVYGRMVDPAGLSGTYHVIRSANGGSSFSSIEDSWGTDFCVDLEVVAVNGSNTAYALRQEAV